MSFSFHPGAQRDLEHAARFYKREGGKAVAQRFIDEVDRVIAMLVTEPGLGTVIEDERRWFPLRGFPYSLIYRPTGPSRVRILVVHHQHRDPEHGSARR